jgi:plasmid stabilization system protein ParE
MARIEFAPATLDDFDRIFDHFADHGSPSAASRIQEIIAAVDVLTTSPAIGRPQRGGTRELVIGSGAKGYVALYRYLDAIDTVIVLAIRSQREAGYKCDD